MEKWKADLMQERGQKKSTTQRQENLRARGAKYEAVAAAFLAQQNYRLLWQNYRSRAGEIDLIALDGRTLCFIEVKYRKNAVRGFPGEAVDARKQARIARTARQFLYELLNMRNTEARAAAQERTGPRSFAAGDTDSVAGVGSTVTASIHFDSLRFDVVEILGDKIRVIKNAFELSL